ncbi:MAG: hypothetical protein V1754_02840, partial [Pseudomonadota bacterium]
MKKKTSKKKPPKARSPRTNDSASSLKQKKPGKPLGKPANGLLDGAAAQRAATATASFNKLPTDIPPQKDPGPGIAVQTSNEKKGGIASEIGQLETRLARRIAGEISVVNKHPALQKIRSLFDPLAHSLWLQKRAMRKRSEYVDAFGLDPISSERARPFLAFLYRNYWRVETSGMENIPDRGRGILVANHSG